MQKGKATVRLVVLASSLVALGGCAELIGSAIDSAANRAGERIGEQVGDAIVRHYTPQFRQFYTSYLFGMAFGAGGYEVAQKDLEPGEWTRFTLTSDPKDSWMERAYLGPDESGNQWWRVKYYDGESGDTVVMEALFAPDRSKMLRLRARFPGDEAPQEMAVQEDAYYVPPQHLTEESIEGATVGTETVTVPAGSYTARHVRFGNPGQGTWEWWLVDSVPGGVVEMKETASKDATDTEGMDPDNWTLALSASGSDAKSELGVK